MPKKLAAAALTLCAAAAPLFTATAATAAIEPRQMIETGSGPVADGIVDLVICLIQLPPSASGDSGQGCPT
ncbi:hypothetical protein ACFO5K_06715 [Nocardia halotolerans]|uniref:Secreted protein n=1 Tax=Nocardia halotolerans TaxID=1755878 RepID=A0ABV8VCU7_9NOCA